MNQTATGYLCTACILVTLVVGVFWWVTSSVHEHGQDARARLAVCQSIQDETLRRDCVSGPRQSIETGAVRTGSVYPSQETTPTTTTP